MKRFIFLSILPIMIYADFLSNYEYAKLLYEKPRGISCVNCHGKKGNGGVLTSYIIELNGNKIIKEIKAPKINNLNKERFLNAFKKRKRFMPDYYLTKEELAYIYFYLIKQGNTNEKQK